MKANVEETSLNSFRSHNHPLVLRNQPGGNLGKLFQNVQLPEETIKDGEFMLYCVSKQLKCSARRCQKFASYFCSCLDLRFCKSCGETENQSNCPACSRALKMFQNQHKSSKMQKHLKARNQIKAACPWSSKCAQKTVIDMLEH